MLTHSHTIIHFSLKPPAVSLGFKFLYQRKSLKKHQALKLKVFPENSKCQSVGVKKKIPLFVFQYRMMLKKFQESNARVSNVNKAWFKMCDSKETNTEKVKEVACFCRVLSVFFCVLYCLEMPESPSLLHPGGSR